MDLLFLNIGIQEMILIMILASLTFIPTILIIVSILDILKRQFKDNSDKVLMVVLIFFLPIIGSCLYLFSLRHNYPLIDNNNAIK